jgi:methylenetetrahydrofolate dehydrogenase (NADP+)/methenyltetrahydrofolate cyclohydrolase
MTVLLGRPIAKAIQEDLKREIDELRQQGLVPTIAPILVGENASARAYYQAKEKLAKDLGIRFAGVKLPATVTEVTLQKEIQCLNTDPNIHGLFVEFPLPREISPAFVCQAIAPEKDIDVINPINIGRFVVGTTTSPSYSALKQRPDVFIPATPQAVMELLLASGIHLAGKRAVVIGRSLAVGRPLSLVLLMEDATVTICHSKTANLATITREADVICIAAGHPGLLTAEMVKKNVVVVDIGANVTRNGITGDVNYEEVAPKAAWITPVPGGVGPVTTTLILANTVKAAQALSPREPRSSSRQEDTEEPVKRDR